MRNEKNHLYFLNKDQFEIQLVSAKKIICLIIRFLGLGRPAGNPMWMLHHVFRILPNPCGKVWRLNLCEY